jgi:integrase
VDNSTVTVAEVLEIPKPKGKYGEGSIIQRGNRWQISFYDNAGRRRRESFSTEAKAERALRQKLVLKEAGKLDEVESRISVDTLADLYLADRKGAAPKSVAWLESVWTLHLKPVFGGFMASRITTEKLIEYRNARLETDASPSTVNKELSTLRAIFNHGLNDYTPSKVSRVPKFPADLTEPPPRSGFLTDEQYDALQTNCKQPWLRALLAVAYTYGFRKSELVGRVQRNQPGMRVSQIDLKNRTIRLNVGTTKNNEGRVVKMTQEVYDLIVPCVEGKQPEDSLFTWDSGKPVKDFRQTWDHLIKAAGVPDLLLHDFRRSAARNLLRAGVDRDVAKRITGHRTDSMFSRYNIVAEADLEDAAAKIESSRIGRKTVTGPEQKS